MKSFQVCVNYEAILPKNGYKLSKVLLCQERMKMKHFEHAAQTSKSRSTLDDSNNFIFHVSFLIKYFFMQEVC